MRKIIFLVLANFILLSCSPEDSSVTSELTTRNKDSASPLTLSDRTKSLVTLYEGLAVTQPPHHLQQQIDLLDSIALQHTIFNSLDLTTYSKTTAVEAHSFLFDAATSIDSLAVSGAMQDYLDLIRTGKFSFSTSYGAIETDPLLTLTEKNTLLFILDQIKPSSGYHDPSWDLKNVVGIIKGFQQNEAQAVFNAALIQIHKDELTPSLE